MKTLLGNSPGDQNEMLRLVNAFTGGDMDTLANRMNECFVSISEDLPRLRATHPIFDIKEPLPAKFTINVSDTKLALDNIKVNKATGPVGIPTWALKECSHLLAAPVTAIFNSYIREGVQPKLWKTTTVIPLSKKHPPVSIDNDIRPISLTPIIAKVFESLVLKLVDVYVKPQIDDKQYGGMAGTCTTDALVEMLHKWYESTDVTGNFARVLFLDYSEDRDQRVKVGDAVSKPGYPNGGVPQGTLSESKHFLVICKRLALFINMLTTALYLKYATKTWYLISRILLTLLSNGLIIMTCVSIRLRPKKWLYVSEETEHL